MRSSFGAYSAAIRCVTFRCSIAWPLCSRHVMSYVQSLLLSLADAGTSLLGLFSGHQI